MENLKINWGMIGVIVLNTFIWYSIFTIGFWITLIWIVVFSAMIGIIIKIRGII